MNTYSIDKIKEIIAPIAEAHDLDKVCLFGSYARGDADENSDMDFLVYGFNNKGYIEFCDMKDEFKSLINIPVDVIRAENLRLKLNVENDKLTKRFVRNLKRDMVVVYEKS